MSAPLFAGGGYTVTADILRTPRKTYALDRIEFVSVTRNTFLMTAVLAVPVIALSMIFIRYFSFGELLTAWLLAGGALYAAWNIGVLKIHSLAIRDDETSTSFGLIWVLRDVRAAVEKAISARRRGEGA